MRQTRKRRVVTAVAAFAVLVGIFLTTSDAATSEAAGTMGPSTPVKVVRVLANGQTIKTYRYHTQSPDEIADVYYDADWVRSRPKRAAIIVVHGGWWHNANRTSGARAAQRWLDSGFVVMNIDFRDAADHQAFVGSGREGTTVTGARWPAQRIDVALAYDWLKANAAQFNIDPARVGLYGFSAGGHIANTAAGVYGTARFRASASISGIQQPQRTADIVMNQGFEGDAPSSTLVKSFGYMTSALGCSYEPTWADCGAKWKSFKPETYFGATKPALYAVKGTIDPVEPISALTATEDLLDRVGQDHLTVAVSDRGHDEALVLGSGTTDVARWNQLVTWMRSKTA